MLKDIRLRAFVMAEYPYLFVTMMPIAKNDQINKWLYDTVQCLKKLKHVSNTE